MPFLQCGSAMNVIADYAEIKGTLRTFDSKFTKHFSEELITLMKEKCDKFGCTFEHDINILYPAVVNHEKETNHIIRLGKEFFGAENVKDTYLPVPASEDFSYFLLERPGCFFFLSSGLKESENTMAHNSNYNFNEDYMDGASRFWLRIAEDRLGFKVQLACLHLYVAHSKISHKPIRILINRVRACMSCQYTSEYESQAINLSLIHISEPTRRTPISYAVFCLKKKK
eukprot:TRINITY_DN6559_c0_g1_i2.p1 TRINITY_DN6559_c0_g1~~TRINITY_DN6559_c0_g1_i2.p1  ORF type:complete len:228 (+),score=22.55 TRINITY_DN6559_c0_g1_i2:213-896(+)